nr:DUF1273 domain-containing protein [Neobacillus sedimentimangrovi]
MIKVLAISGYKPYELGIFKNNDPSVYYIKAAFKKALLSKLDEGLEWILISGQLGAELWAAEVVLDLKVQYPDLKLAVITPFLEQEASWNENNREWYHTVLAQADFVNSVTKKKYENPWQFHLKNQFMIEKSDGLLLLYDQDKEGTPKYIFEFGLKYQEKNEYPIDLITFYDLQMIVEEGQMKQVDF